MGGPGPIIFVLSLVCALLIWSRNGMGPAGPGLPRHTPPALPDRAGVDGWAGAFDSLHGRLMPLHADAARQAFDAAVLQRRLGLGPGQPWRLVVTYLPRGEAVGAAVPIAGLTVVDAEGLALRPIVDRPGPGVVSGVTDPLRSLLRAPEQLEPGYEVSLVLWGRAPLQVGDEAPRIVGVAGADRSWELEARQFDRAPSQPSLARLERSLPGPMPADASGRPDRVANPGAQTPR